MKKKPWYKIDQTEDVVSPALLVYPDRIARNIHTIIKMAGGTKWLRPHIKTHKIAEIIKLQIKFGIHKFKCATIPEAQLLADTGAQDILLAMQPVGTNVNRFFKLIELYPACSFSTLVDHTNTIEEIGRIAAEENIQVNIWLDINNGMNRTGIEPGQKAIELYRQICDSPHLIAKGFHVYDGHIHEEDLEKRKTQCNQDFEAVDMLKQQLLDLGYEVPTIVAGGTPTFPIHKDRKSVETSPGTPLLWDEGYAHAFMDLNFLPSAVLLTRVISQPKKNWLCLDLGHKAVASEMKLPRVKFLGTDAFEQISHSEEHMVVTTNEDKSHRIGSVNYAIPMHICPTITKYKEVLTVVDGAITGSWKIAARDH